MLDTLTIARRLTEAGLEPTQANAITERDPHGRRLRRHGHQGGPRHAPRVVTDYAAQHEQHAAALEQHATAWQAQQQQLSTQVGILTEQYAHITADYKTRAALLAQV